LRRVVEKGGEERFGVVNFKVFYGGLVDAFCEREGGEGGQKRELGSQ
jgi:hypothetical protein